MRALYKDTAQKSVDEEGEGAVIYLVGEEKVFSLCKLKTLEYRLFRKLREKLKGLLNSKKDFHSIYKSYQRECDDL